jgi:hypothetical protein
LISFPGPAWLDARYTSTRLIVKIRLSRDYAGTRYKLTPKNWPTRAGN